MQNDRVVDCKTSWSRGWSWLNGTGWPGSSREVVGLAVGAGWCGALHWSLWQSEGRSWSVLVGELVDLVW